MRTRTITASQDDYPADMALLELAAGTWGRGAPPLYVRGQLPSRPGVAIVGTRCATEAALAFTGELAAALARDGWCVWSGGAYGIDHASHRSALDAGGTTVVVTAGSLDDPYPGEHSELYQEVVQRGGGLVSLQPDGARRQRYQFMQRNYVMAALSDATIVTEMPLKSGAMYTAKAAQTLAKPLLFVPHAPWSDRGGGSARAIAAGARAIASVEGALAILRKVTRYRTLARELDQAMAAVASERDDRRGGRTANEKGERSGREVRRSGPDSPLAEAGALARKDVELGAPLAAVERSVYAVLNHSPTHVDGICEAAELPFARVSRALLTLTLHGLVVEGPSGHYGRSYA